MISAPNQAEIKSRRPRDVAAMACGLGRFSRTLLVRPREVAACGRALRRGARLVADAELWETSAGSALLARNEGRVAPLFRFQLFAEIRLPARLQLLALGQLETGAATDEDGIQTTVDLLVLRHMVSRAGRPDPGRRIQFRLPRWRRLVADESRRLRAHPRPPDATGGWDRVLTGPGNAIRGVRHRRAVSASRAAGQPAAGERWPPDLAAFLPNGYAAAVQVSYQLDVQP